MHCESLSSNSLLSSCFPPPSVLMLLVTTCCLMVSPSPSSGLEEAASNGSSQPKCLTILQQLHLQALKEPDHRDKSPWAQRRQSRIQQDQQAQHLCCSVCLCHSHHCPSPWGLTLCIPNPQQPGLLLASQRGLPLSSQCWALACSPGRDGLGPAAPPDEDKWDCADQQTIWGVHHLPLD